MEFTFPLGPRWPRASVKRPRKSTICRTCAQRRIKCDRAKPSCGSCQSRSLPCTYAEAQQIVKPHRVTLHAQRPLLISALPGDINRTSGSSNSASVSTPNSDEEPIISAGMLAVDKRSGATQYANTAFWPSFFSDVRLVFSCCL